MTLPGTLSPRHLIERVAMLYELPVGALTSGCRTNDHRDRADARHLAMWLIRRHAHLSLPAIGRLFGGRDHTSVLYAIRKVDKARLQPEIAEQIDRFEKELFQ